jgi:hypothetical protein
VIYISLNQPFFSVECFSSAHVIDYLQDSGFSPPSSSIISLLCLLLLNGFGIVILLLFARVPMIYEIFK